MIVVAAINGPNSSGDTNCPAKDAVADSATVCPRSSCGAASPTSTVKAGKARPLPSPNSTGATAIAAGASTSPRMRKVATQDAAAARSSAS
nr:hypothetical protein [Amycolatopsis keratiniphila]